MEGLLSLSHVRLYRTGGPSFKSNGLQDIPLQGLTFLDVGCGSGLFSLAAHRLGAHVHSFDFDPQAAACAQELKRRYGGGTPMWTIETGSVLDRSYLCKLGQFDIVYCWGVAHHTGAMWEALGNLPMLVGPGGYLYIAIYNTQIPWSSIWRAIKKLYNRLPEPLRTPYTFLAILPVESIALARHTLFRLRPEAYFQRWTRYFSNRGMDRWRDIVDWVGGYPFETARPKEVLAYYRRWNVTPIKVKTCANGSGCNEYVFRTLDKLSQ